MAVEPLAFHLTMVLGHWSKVARIQEAGLWRGDPNSPEYGHGNPEEAFVTMDIVMPQVSPPSFPCSLGPSRHLLLSAVKSSVGGCDCRSRWQHQVPSCAELVPVT